MSPLQFSTMVPGQYYITIVIKASAFYSDRYLSKARAHALQHGTQRRHASARARRGGEAVPQARFRRRRRRCAGEKRRRHVRRVLQPFRVEGRSLSRRCRGWPGAAAARRRALSRRARQVVAGRLRCFLSRATASQGRDRRLCHAEPFGRGLACRQGDARGLSSRADQVAEAVAAGLPGTAGRDAAWPLLAQVAGGVLLARAVHDEALAKEISAAVLEAVQRHR